MRFAAIAFAILVIVGTLIFVGEEGSTEANSLDADGAFGSADHRANPIEPFVEDGEAPPPVVIPEGDSVQFADDEDLMTDEGLIDDALGIDVEGYDPQPSLETNQDVDAVEEIIIVDTDGSGP